MLILHGVCTAVEHRKGEKVNTATGEVKPWAIDTYHVFDGQRTLKCLLADTFDGEIQPGDIVTAKVGTVSEYRNEPQLQLLCGTDARSAEAFTPELAALLMQVGMLSAPGSTDTGKRAAA